MKKLLAISLLLAGQLATAATITIENNTNEMLRVKVMHGDKNKSSQDAILPGKSSVFNTWASSINTITWNNHTTMWTAPVIIEGLNQGATFDINENGKYVLKPCITCKKQKQMKADSQRFVGGAMAAQ